MNPGATFQRGAAASPDDAALHQVLVLLLSLALLAATVPLFGAAYVFRWFQSLRVAGLVVAGLAAVAVPPLLLWRAPRPPQGGVMAIAAVCGAAATLALLAVALTAQTPDPVRLFQARRALVLPALALALVAAIIVAAGRAAARGQGRRADAIAWGAVAVAWLTAAATVVTLALSGGE